MSQGPVAILKVPADHRAPKPQGEENHRQVAVRNESKDKLGLVLFLQGGGPGGTSTSLTTMTLGDGFQPERLGQEVF